MRYVFFFALSLVICGCAVKKTKKIDLFFGLPEYPNSVYEIDFRHSRMTCTKFDYGNMRDSVKKRKYDLSKQEVKQLRAIFPEKREVQLVEKVKSDNSSFGIRQINKKKDTVKTLVGRRDLNPGQYQTEVFQAESFFKTAYAIVRDTAGIDILDAGYIKVFKGLPVRKISDSPLEYKIWSGMGGNRSHNPDLFEFLDSLPKDRCVIVDCGNNLTQSLQEEILKSYILKGSNIRFADMRQMRNIENGLRKLSGNPQATGVSKLLSELYAGESGQVRLWLESRENTTTLDLHQLRAECNR